MLAATVLALCLQPTIIAGKFEFAERMKQLDVAWRSTPDKAKRREAVPKIEAAFSASDLGRFSNGCRNLDEATAALEGRALRSEDALSFRFLPPVVEPGVTAQLVVSWAYTIEGAGAIQVVAGIRTGTAVPGRTLEMFLNTPTLNPETARDPEAAVLVPIQAGEVRRSAFISVVKSFGKRLEALKAAKSPVARGLAEPFELAIRGEAEMDLPAIQYLIQGEQLESGERLIGDFEQVLFAKERRTVFRAAIPKVAKLNAPVVVAIPDVGDTENAFFEFHGRGMAMQEAMKRGWVFLSVRASDVAAQDALKWLERVRGVRPGSLFLMGHGEGATAALRSTGVTSLPNAVAIFAPSSEALIGDSIDMPVFLGTSRPLEGAAPTHIGLLVRSLRNRPKSRVKEYADCGPRMLVANAIKDAFTFFDRFQPAPQR